MSPIAGPAAEIATMRLDEFRDYAEFSAYLQKMEPLRSARWLYERSLAAAEPEITLAGTCGICLCPARFRSGTAGGERLDGGAMVPNFREEMACDCEAALINRERGLLHFLLYKRLLSLATRVLAIGASRSLNGLLERYVSDLTCHGGPLGPLPPGAGSDRKAPRRYHLLVAVDQFDGSVLSQQRLEMMYNELVEGGRVVFTAPFNLGDPATVSDDDPLPGWSILRRFRIAGFRDAIAHGFWSEEFGYLGLNNFVFQAIK